MDFDIVEVPADLVPVIVDAHSGLSTTDWVTIASGFGGVLLGSLIGAAVSWFLQRAAGKEAQRQRLLDRTADQKARWSKLQIYASIILSDVAASQAAMQNSIRNADAQGASPNTPLWQKVVPMLGGMKPIPIDIDLLAPLIDAKEYDLVGRIIELSMQHQVLSDTIEIYNELRMSMKDRLSNHIEVKDGRIGTIVTNEEAMKLAPHTLELESLVQAMRERLSTIVPLAREVTFAIGPAAQKHFSDPSFPIMGPSDAPPSPQGATSTAS